MKKILMTLTLAMAAMIAIPTVANAQDTKQEQKKECCKDNKECTKDAKDCAKENGKPCCKEGKKGMQKNKAVKKAKGDRRRGANDKGRMKRGGGENPMFKGITLSADQQQKLQALREKNKTAEKKSKADMKAKSKEEMQKIRADFDKEVEKILDKDQLKQYQANKTEMEAKRAERQAKQPKSQRR